MHCFCHSPSRTTEVGTNFSELTKLGLYGDRFSVSRNDRLADTDLPSIDDRLACPAIPLPIATKDTKNSELLKIGVCELPNAILLAS